METIFEVPAFQEKFGFKQNRVFVGSYFDVQVFDEA
jgi:hypothetical protein